MIVYHVTTPKKFKKYMQNKAIQSPVAAWVDLYEAERFARQTGRTIILRLGFPNTVKQLFGHKNKAVLLEQCYPL